MQSPENTIVSIGYSPRYKNEQHAIDQALQDGLFYLALQKKALVDWKNAEVENYGFYEEKFVELLLPDENTFQKIEKNYTVLDSLISSQEVYLLLGINKDLSKLKDGFFILGKINYFSQLINGDSPPGWIRDNTNTKDGIFIQSYYMKSDPILNEHTCLNLILKEISKSINYQTGIFTRDYETDRYSDTKSKIERKSSSIINNLFITDRYFDVNAQTYFIRAIYEDK